MTSGNGCGWCFGPHARGRTTIACRPVAWSHARYLTVHGFVCFHGHAARLGVAGRTVWTSVGMPPREDAARCATAQLRRRQAPSVAALVIEDKLLLGGAILVLALLAAVASRRLQLPLLITFLALGMLLGSEGLGGIYFDNAQLARSIGILALIAILFEGGLSTDWPDIRPVAVPALVLGAVVGSTDAAAVFATLRFTTLRRRLAALLNAESGANDPMAVALTLGLIAWIEKPGYGVDDLLLLLARQLGLGLLIGVGLGLVARWLLPRLPTDLAPFAPVA